MSHSVATFIISSGKKKMRLIQNVKQAEVLLDAVWGGTWSAAFYQFPFLGRSGISLAHNTPYNHTVFTSGNHSSSPNLKEYVSVLTKIFNMFF